MVIADSGFWVALASPNDKHHTRARQCLDELREPLITTWPVITETCHLLLQRRGHLSQRQFIASYAAGAFAVFDLTEKHTPRLLQLLEQYADLPIDLADASLVILAEFLGHGKILSTDVRDFRTYRWKRIVGCALRLFAARTRTIDVLSRARRKDGAHPMYCCQETPP